MILPSLSKLRHTWLYNLRVCPAEGAQTLYCTDASVLFQLNNPTLVEGLVLLNVDPCAEGWIDWAASKVHPKRTPQH